MKYLRVYIAYTMMALNILALLVNLYRNNLGVAFINILAVVCLVCVVRNEMQFLKE